MEWFALKAMASSKRNGFHHKEWLPLKEVASAKKWLLLKGMASTRRHGFH